MELNLQKQKIAINETVFDGTVEQSVECDAQLPDYCPDISKILKCAVTAGILSTTVAAERLTIEGLALIRVYYLPDQGGIRKAEYKVPFSKLVELRAAARDPIITVTPSVDYVNCRAVNQRRVDVRGALSLGVTVTDRGEAEVISGAEGAGLQLKSELVQATELTCRSESSFTLQEELELGYGKSAIGTVIRTACTAIVQDYKIVSGKVVAKGEVSFQFSYLPADTPDRLEVMEYTLPISQIIDCEGIDEQSVCEIALYVQSCDIQPKANDAGEYQSFVFEARVTAAVCAWQQREVAVADDCYSTGYTCSCKQKAIPFLRLEKILAETIQRRETLDLPEGVEEISDLWCEIDRMDWSYQEEQIALNLRLSVCMFAKMAEDGSTLYFEQPVEISESVPVSCAGDSVRFDPCVDIASCAYNLSGGSIELRAEISLRGCVFCSIRQTSLSEIEIDESSPKQKEKNKLYLYYADDGESVWDIAKRYNTSSGAIWEENSLEQDILRGKSMLLIPIV